jgi:hypothetical protein
MFFFEKKNQKTFGHGSGRGGEAAARYAKVFGFFFSRKKAFPSFSNSQPG